jgi:HJR/Mrr/RecB family endonuclease
MSLIKLNGLLQQIVERYPNVDLVEFLQEELQLPPAKAEILAQKIEKKYCQKTVHRNNLHRLLQNLSENKPCLEGEYSVDCLSDKEFRYFVHWLIEELGYNIQQENRDIESAADFTVEKNGEPLLIVARKYPINAEVSEAIFLVSEKAKQVYGRKRSIVMVTTYFSVQAKAEAQRLGIEIWDRDVLAQKIAQIRREDALEVPLAFPKFTGSLLDSLLRLEESKDFVIEQRVNGRFELFLAGVKFPLLTFQSEGDKVVRCVFRMKNYQPVGEQESQALIWTDEANNRFGLSDADAYDAVIKYLKDFIE